MTQTLRSIQHLRGLAALAVVVYHALQWRDGGFELGRAGVDVFFVISGVIMWLIAGEGEVSAPVFLRRRFARVAPTYWIATLAVALAVTLSPRILPQVRVDPARLALSLAFWPHRDHHGLPFPVLPAGWTLWYEAFFYLLFALTLALPISPRARIWTLTGALAGFVVVGVTVVGSLYEMIANPMLLQFVAGLWIGRAVRRGGLKGAPLGSGLIAAGLFIFAVFSAPPLFSELWRPFQWGAAATLIVAGALALERGGAWPQSRALSELGEASYSLYLWHTLAIGLVANALGWGVSVWIMAPLAIGAAILVSLALTRWLETPLRRRLRG